MESRLDRKEKLLIAGIAATIVANVAWWHYITRPVLEIAMSRWH